MDALQIVGLVGQLLSDISKQNVPAIITDAEALVAEIFTVIKALPVANPVANPTTTTTPTETE